MIFKKFRIYTGITAIWLCSLSGMLLEGGKAYAQMTTETKKGSLKEVPQELQSPGLTYHGFKYLPALGISTRYDDNVYASHEGQKSDIITSFAPSISVTKDYKGLSLGFNAGAELERYMDYASENKNNYNMAFRGEYEANRSWKFPFSFSYHSNFRNRASPLGTTLSTSEPVRVKYGDMSGGVIRRFNRLSLGLIGQYGVTKLEDGTSDSNPAVPVVFSDNNRTMTEGRLEITYELLRDASSTSTPEHFLYAILKRGHQDFEKRSWDGTGFDGVRRDRDTSGALFGFQTNYKDMILANIGAGYLEQDFVEPSLKKTSTYDLKADIKYLMTPKLVLGFKTGREIAQDNDLLQGVVRSSYDLSAEYELHHNIYLNGSVGYGIDDFAKIDRQDKNLAEKLGLSYIFGPRLSANVEVSHFDRSSTEATREISRSVVMIGIKTNL